MRAPRMNRPGLAKRKWCCAGLAGSIKSTTPITPPISYVMWSCRFVDGFREVLNLSYAFDLPDGHAAQNPVQSHLQKYFASPVGQIISTTLRIPPHHRGVSRSSRTRGADAVDAAAFCARRDRRAGYPVSGQQRADERRCCVRRSRVVLTPRRWRQVRGCYVGPTGLRHNVSPRTTVANKPGHRGEREGNR
jgi:hypothetical protein